MLPPPDMMSHIIIYHQNFGDGLTVTFRPLHQRSGGAGVEARPTRQAVRSSDPILIEITDYRIEAPAGKTQPGQRVLLPADPNTNAAQHAPVGVVVQHRVANVHLRLLEYPFEGFASQPGTQKPGNILQLAGAVGRAGFAFHPVNREQEFECGLLKAADR